MDIKHRLAAQFRQPKGLFGKLVGFIMSRQNREPIKWIISLLDIQPNDHVLEIGFGPGTGIKIVSEQTLNGRVCGVDISETMVKKAHKLNAKAIESGLVEFVHGDASSIPYGDQKFDKVFGVNIIYFWREPLQNLKELRRVMKPGGIISFFIYSRDDMEKIKFTLTDIYTLYNSEEVEKLLIETGFRSVRSEEKTFSSRTGICVFALK